MASIISVDTLQDSAGSNEITTANVKTAFDDRVKAWANLNGDGSGAPTRNSLNVSSTTDIGTGRYTLNFTNNFNAADFACTGGCGETTTGSTNFFCNPCNVLVGEVTLVIYSAAASLTDRDNVHGIVMGDLA